MITDTFSAYNVERLENSETELKQERTKIWELDHIYHCAVIGTCLTMDEVMKLLRSFNINLKENSAYDIHTTIVTLLSYPDYRSKKVQSYLNKKFKIALHKTRKMNASELRTEWKRVIDSGELIATFWAVISHPSTNKQMKRDFYGDIHMQSHMSGASCRVDLRRLKQLERERKKYNTEILTEQAKYRKVQSDNVGIQSYTQQKDEIISDLNNQVAALSNANVQLTILKGVEEIDQLRSQIERLNNKIKFQVDELAISKNKNSQYQQLVADLNEKIEVNEQIIIEYKSETDHLQYVLSQNKLEEKCLFKKQGLCGQCVLYVGGKANLIPYYRELVEAKSGVFLHHDGGIEKSTQDLSQSLNRADLVVFPSDCISHDAYWKIKKTCKKQQKPYEYLKSPGLHSLSNVLEEISLKVEG